MHKVALRDGKKMQTFTGPKDILFFIYSVISDIFTGLTTF